MISMTVLPLGTMLFGFSFLVATYVISANSEHPGPTAILPVISQTADVPLQAAVFSFGLSLLAPLLLLIMIAEHSKLAMLIRSSPDPALKTAEPLQFVSMFFGVLGLVGLFGCATFQQAAYSLVRLSFAALFFTCIIIYVDVLSWMSHRCHLRNRLVYFRFLLSSAATVGFCVCVGFTMVWLMNGVRGDWIDNVNCVCETFVTWTIVLFFGTFSSDLLGYEMRFGISKSDPGSYAVLPEGRR